MSYGAQNEKETGMTEKPMFRLAVGLALVLSGALLGATATGLGVAIRDQDARIAQLERPIAAPFTDIQGHWAENYIEQIRLAGLTAGCSVDPSMYCPDRPLTRAEAAVFMARLLEWPR